MTRELKVVIDSIECFEDSFENRRHGVYKWVARKGLALSDSAGELQIWLTCSYKSLQPSAISVNACGFPFGSKVLQIYDSFATPA